MENFDRAKPLDNMTVLVTGAGRGIGRACVLACAEAGARVIALARTRGDLDEVRRLGGEAIEVWTADVSDRGVWREVEGRDIDVLVNNAATNRLQNLEEVDDETYDRLFDVNVRSVFKLSQAAVRAMLAHGRGGSIVNITSQMGHVAGPRRAVYVMTKHAIEGLTKAMALEFAERGIRVNAVAPTIVETSMTEPLFKDPGYMDYAMATIPLKRVAKPEDIAEAVVYLASPAARMVTGTSLRVDGGATAQ